MLRSRLEHRRERAAELVRSIPVVGRILSELVRVELVDRCVVVAAQSLFALVPLVLVASAFAPQAARDRLVEQIGSVMAIGQTDLGDVTAAVTAEEVRAQTGLVGLVVVLVSASSFARSLQRMFERIWERPHLGGVVALRRSVWWMVVCVGYLQLLSLLLSVLTGFPGSSLLRITGQLVASTALWWWSAHVLLQGRQPWSSLWPAALITAIGVVLLTRASHVLMPPYVRSNVEQFGALGLVFATSTWLLIFGGTIVVANVLGRIAAEDLGLQSRRWTLSRRDSTARPSLEGHSG